ncbi:MAG: tRNA (adenosine(37)-N6)-dimethylallyltransferase MiaA [Pseudomonadota bacterium]|nr:tRNA (adenosine(37)-N6)-dimethylallyltransferase MiaA [Pseudomonadota bacterium]
MAELPLIALMGPTASGKTGLALALAEHYPVEIISVDSAQIYRGMDIGTAKVTAEQQALVPHHLIDILDPAEPYSAARFAADAQSLIVQIRARGRTPLLVGGTMLYFRALLDGLSALPSADPAIRELLEARAREQGVASLHAELQRIDPEAGARLHPNDQQRIQRALEIHAITGLPASEFYRREREPSMLGSVVRVGLIELPREVLHARIDRRFDEMIDGGLVDEVARLRERVDLHPALPSVRAVGYRQIWAHLDGECDLDEAIARGKAATRQYAKRQLTWMRSEPNLHRMDPLAPNLLDQVRSLLS